MTQTLTKIYFVPGMAAGAEIFERIHLPEDRFHVEILEWFIPEKNETITAYAGRMAQLISEESPVLVGVSFGGVIAQEMKQFMPKAKVIIISSVKSKFELPKRFLMVRKSRFYRMIPTGLLVNAKDLTRFAIGPWTKRRLQLYNTYLSVRDKRYLDWAIKQMVCWDREIPDPEVVHIHGDRDIVFPIKNIKNALAVKGGTHAMILYRAKAVSDQLLNVLKDK